MPIHFAYLAAVRQATVDVLRLGRLSACPKVRADESRRGPAIVFSGGRWRRCRSRRSLRERTRDPYSQYRCREHRSPNTCADTDSFHVKASWTELDTGCDNVQKRIHGARLTRNCRKGPVSNGMRPTIQRLRRGGHGFADELSRSTTPSTDATARGRGAGTWQRG